MGSEIDLLAAYPRTSRKVHQRATERTAEDVRRARRFGRDFFDGDRRYGYGGYSYHPRFWQPVVPAFVERYSLTPKSRVLDVGCGKGFFLYDLQLALPGIEVQGIDVSPYAIAHGKPEVRSRLAVADAAALPFADSSFDLVVSITTVHNLEGESLDQSLSEIERVGRGQGFLTVDAWASEEERQRIEGWALTALTILHVDDWRDRFAKAGYSGDYYWFVP
ncbi:MAG: class I SAM-dependent methyltransferase [Deltaproteobacteria bacterium]|nr:class I SAM-dependent methyltransferase [Deltaproteobacteria bacterium]